MIDGQGGLIQAFHISMGSTDMRAIAVAVLAALVSLPASASDFSALGKPEFARSLLMSPGRQRDLTCVGLALANARLKRGVSRDASAMGAALRALLAIELGSDPEAGELIERNQSGWGPQFYDTQTDAAQRYKAMVARSAECSPLFAAFQSGGISKFRAALSPSAGLIPLLPLPMCIALVERSAKDNGSDSFFNAGDLEEIRDLIAKGLSTEKRAALEQATAAARLAIAQSLIDPIRLRSRALSCLAVFHQSIDAGQMDQPRE